MAAAEAPARPVPTTMTSNFRLLAGFTNFISNLCFSHLSASGPEGIFASSFMLQIGYFTIPSSTDKGIELLPMKITSAMALANLRVSGA